MFFKKNRESEKKVFNKTAFEYFVEIIKNTTGGQWGEKEIPIKYSYMGVEYNHMLYGYKYNNDGQIASVLFSLPKTEQNKSLSCYVVSMARTVDEAMETLKNFTENKYV